MKVLVLAAAISLIGCVRSVSQTPGIQKIEILSMEWDATTIVLLPPERLATVIRQDIANGKEYHLDLGAVDTVTTDPGYITRFTDLLKEDGLLVSSKLPFEPRTVCLLFRASGTTDTVSFGPSGVMQVNGSYYQAPLSLIRLVADLLPPKHRKIILSRGIFKEH